MPERICTIEGCSKPLIAWGLCGMHYKRWRVWGDPSVVNPNGRTPEASRARKRAKDRWALMIRRCTDPRNNAWKNYGGRGITICPEWMDFETYYKDVGDCPRPGLSLDRTNNDGNYEPGNVRWATRSEQRRNQRPTIPKTHCPQGHPFDEANTRVPPGTTYRSCKICGAASSARNYARRKAREAA